MNNTPGRLEKGSACAIAVDLLFIGNLEHAEESLATGTRRPPKPHCDEILFRRAVKVQLLRIVRPKREIYKKHHSVTQSEKPIRNFEVFYRNLAEEESRYSLLSRTEELLANPNDDVLVTAREGVYTDVLVVRGFFTKITLCVYGYLLNGDAVREKCPSYGCDVRMERPLPTISAGGEGVRSQLLESMLETVEQGNCNLAMDYVDAWYEGGADDDQTQIRLISHITDRLQQSLLALSQVRLPSDLVHFRNHLEQLHSELNKLIRTKHLGVYYPSPFRPSQLPLLLPEALPLILLKCFQLYDSDKFRALENLRLLLQLPHMANTFVEAGGLHQLFQLHVLGEFSFSTMRTLLLEVLLVLAQYPPAVRVMTDTLLTDAALYEFVMRDEESGSPYMGEPPLVSVGRTSSRSRSRDRKRKDRSSNRSKERSKDGSRDRKKKDTERKDKKKRKYSDDSEESQERKKGKKKERKEKNGKDKSEKNDRKENRKRSRSRTPEKKKREQPDTSVVSAKKKPERHLTFYQMLLMQLRREQPYKQSVLMKLLIQQLTQSVTRDSRLSEQLAVYSPLLRESRFLFNPSKELVNPKTLKIFASFEPVLNAQQSAGVSNCQFVSDVAKVADPKRYGLDVKVHKLINTVSCKISFGEFDEEFILFMSELILSQGITTIGLNRVVEALKSSNLRRNEAALVLLMDYLYKVLLADEGMTTVLYLDQIFSALLPISKALKEERVSSFSRELSRSTKFLINYVAIFDYFLKENILKSLAESFLKLFRYVHIEASKFLEFEQVQQGETRPLNLNALKETFNMGSFYELLPEQPLLELDVCLKIFVVLCHYNRNIWTSYYEHKLTNGFAVLFNKLCYLLSFMLSKTIDMEYSSTEMQHRARLIGCYLDVACRLLTLFVDKLRYESAFNELQAEDEEDDVQLHTVCLRLFQECYAAFYDPELRVTGAAHAKLHRTMELIVEVYYQFCEGVDLSHSKQRQRKLKRLLDRNYISHFQTVANRAAVLSLYALSLRTTRGSTRELIVQYLLARFEFQYDTFDSELSLVPSNDRSVLDNLLKSSVYRSEVTLRNALVQLVRVLMDGLQHSTAFAVYRLFDGLFRELTNDLKNSDAEQQQSRICLDKIILFLEVFHDCCSPVFKHFALCSQFDDQLVKLLKHTQGLLTAATTNPMLHLALFRLRNTCLRLFGLLIDCTVSLRPQGPHALDFDTPTVQVQQLLFKCLNQYIQQVASLFPAHQSNLSPEIRREMLRSCELSLQICVACCRSMLTQTVMLYGEYVENAYHPECQISFEVLFKLPSIALGEDQPSVLRLVEAAMFVLVGLTQQPRQGYFNCERRKIAIRSLLGSVSFEEVVQKLPLPRCYFKFLEQYFGQPSQQIKITRESEPSRDLQEVLKQAREQRDSSKKTYLDKAFDNLSGTMLDIITEGEEPAKARYLLVCPPWIGGDYRNLFDPLNAVDCKAHVSAHLKLLEANTQTYDSLYKFQRTGPPTEYNELMLLYTKKQYPERAKKSAPWTISLKHIPLELKAPAEEPHRELPKSITPPSVYTKPSYLVNPTPTPAATSYSAYSNPTEPFQSHAPSLPPAPKYMPPTLPSSLHHEPRHVDRPHQPQPHHAGYDMFYHASTPTHHNYYGSSPYPGGYGHVAPVAAKRQPTQEEYMMMQYQMQQQQMLRRQERQRTDLTAAYQQAVKLLQVIYSKDVDGDTRGRAERDLEHVMSRYPELQKMLREQMMK